MTPDGAAPGTGAYGGPGAGGAHTLIVGSYPPIPVAGAPVTLAEVRRAWAAGDEVTVVSPRLSAAHLTVPVAGLLAGRRLDNVRRVTGAERLVLVVEDGFPVPAGPPALQMAAVMLIEPALRRFRHVRLVRVQAPGSPSRPATAGLAAPAWRRLAGAVAGPGRSGEVVEVTGGPGAPGVTPLGPPEVPARQMPARIADAALRKALGPRAPLVRARLGRVRRALRQAAGR